MRSRSKGGKGLYRDILELVEDRLRPGALILADNADLPPAYLVRVLSPPQDSSRSAVRMVMRNSNETARFLRLLGLQAPRPSGVPFPAVARLDIVAVHCS